MKTKNLIVAGIILIFTSCVYAMEQQRIEPSAQKVSQESEKPQKSFQGLSDDVVITHILIPQIEQAQSMEELHKILDQGRVDKRYYSLMKDHRVQDAIQKARERVKVDKKQAEKIIKSLNSSRLTVSDRQFTKLEVLAFAAGRILNEPINRDTLKFVIAQLMKHEDIKALNESGDTLVQMIQRQLEIICGMPAYEGFNQEEKAKGINKYLLLEDLFLEMGVLVNNINKRGETALDMAKQSKLNRSIELLRKYGAKTAAELKNEK